MIRKFGGERERAAREGEANVVMTLPYILVPCRSLAQLLLRLWGLVCFVAARLLDRHRRTKVGPQ